MISRNKAGLQVETKIPVRGYGGDVPRGSRGIIVYEHDNGVGRLLVRVSFGELQITRDVLEEDIEILDECSR